MKTVMVISFTNLATDPRVNRQIRGLAERYRVVAVGLNDPQVEGVTFIACSSPRKSLPKRVQALFQLLGGRFEGYYWGLKHVQDALKDLRGVAFDAIIANDIDSLPLALRVADGAPVVMDAHEYAPKEFEDRWQWRLLFMRYKEYLCRTYMPKAQATLTVCEGIADEYHAQYGVRPVVVTNAPDFESLEPHGTDPRRIRLIHHGGAIPSRRIENMIRMMDHLDERFELDFMLVPSDPKYHAELEAMAQGKPRIRFIPPVPMREIAQTIAAYDMGIYLLEPNSFNNRMALPNKFFEFIQARLAVAIGPSPEMARVVREHGLGVVTEDFSPVSLAQALGKLDADQIDAYKRGSHEAAALLSAEENRRRLLGVLDQVLE